MKEALENSIKFWLVFLLVALNGIAVTGLAMMIHATINPVEFGMWLAEIDAARFAYDCDCTELLE